MSLNTILMAETMPAEEILEEFHKLENGLQSTTARFAELVHYSYHRGCLIQMSRCIVRYMVHHNCSYEDALKVFDDSLLQGMNLKKEKEGFEKLYAALSGMKLQETDKIVDIVCNLCQSYQSSAFAVGVKVGAKLEKELQ